MPDADMWKWARPAGMGVLILVGITIAEQKAQDAKTPHPFRPPALQAGDTIGIVAPGHPLDRDRIAQAVRRLEAMGFRTRVIGDVYTRRGYLAATDAQRAQAVMAAFLDPQVKAVFCGTGGYGTTRVLERLDFDIIRRNPKILLGFSDVTALHLAIHKETGQITFHGPNLMWGLGSEDRNLTPFASVHMWCNVCDAKTLAALAARSAMPDAGEPVPGFQALTRTSPDGTLRYDLSLCEPDTPPAKTLRPGRARGRLVGGNLSLVCALMGTPWQIETKGRILFLEDVGEEPYRIDRFLRQLKHAGLLDGVAGVILGRWHKCVPEDPEKSLTLDEVFADYFGDAPYPVVTQFPIGHVRDNATLPLGVLAELDATALTLTLLEPAVE
ncbi:MAG: LD-carboxypeptidase [Phycisphaerae bacterium]|nr:LD-carboxypeptidase [Phycisphaerae bacterium]